MSSPLPTAAAPRVASSPVPGLLRAVGRVPLAAAFVVLGLALRVRHFLTNPSYWYDEAYTLLNVFDRPYAELVGRLDNHAVAPLGALWLWRAAYDLLGPAEWAMRLPNFLAGVAALLLMVPLARRAVPGPVTWLPVAFLALSRFALPHGCSVRPYTFDLLLMVSVLLAVVAATAEEATPAARRTGRLGLLLLAAVGPWFSYPFAFGLAAAGAAVGVRALRTGRRADWLFAVAVGVVAAASGLAMWQVHARHQVYEGLSDHWGPGGWGGFPDLEHPLSALKWPLKTLVDTGNYGTQEMGIPFAVLGAIGLWRLARRNLPLAVAVAGPAALAVAAAFLRKYPLADRTVFFLLPGLWLAVAAGVAAVVERLPRRWAWVLPLALLVPDGINAAVNLAAPTRYAGDRDAFERIHTERQPGDVLWVSHPEVYQVYHGRGEEVFCYLTPPDELARRTAGRRVWLVYHPGPLDGLTAQVGETLKRSGHVLERVDAGRGTVVQLWVPAGE